MVPADKAANNIVVVCRLQYINTLKQELKVTKAYEKTSTDEKAAVNSSSNHYHIKLLYLLRNAKTNFIQSTGYLSFTKDHIKLVSLLNLALALLQNCLNY